MPGSSFSSSSSRPPSTDRLARSVEGRVPHPVAVAAARRVIADGWDETGETRFLSAIADYGRSRLRPVLNATGVILHTNLGRAPSAFTAAAAASNLELDLATGRRGLRAPTINADLALLCGAEDALVTNNGAGALLLVLAALAAPGKVAVSRGELVEIGGGFRVPDVMAQSGVSLVEVGTTNRTRASDFAAAVTTHGLELKALLKVHPSNFAVTGFTETTSVAAMTGAASGLPVIFDVGSGLIDAACPWLDEGPPRWLTSEPAVRQSLENGADVVTFSGDKLMGGPQAGLIVGRADLIARCRNHPLFRALRAGGLVLGALAETVELYLNRRADELPVWRCLTADATRLGERAIALSECHRDAVAVRSQGTPGGGTTPGVTLDSAGVWLAGDHLAHLRELVTPVIARQHNFESDDRLVRATHTAVPGTSGTLIDLVAIDEGDDPYLAAALSELDAASSNSGSAPVPASGSGGERVAPSGRLSGPVTAVSSARATNSQPPPEAEQGDDPL